MLRQSNFSFCRFILLPSSTGYERMLLIENTAYRIEIEQARQTREDRMLSNPLNWFTLVGLFPLADGINRVGREENLEITLPSLPEGCRANFEARTDGVFLISASEGFTVNGQPPTGGRLRQDVDGDPDLVEIGAIAMRVINRNSRPYLRVWDREAPALRDFHGLDYFPVDPAYRIQAEFVPFDPPRSIRIADAIGGEHEILFPGEARFTVSGVACTLIAEDDEDGLLFNFTDPTRADSTYPGGRYVLTPYPKNCQVTLDFNLARNWPCAYTSFATCPLPPAQNHLKVRVEAGEKRYHALGGRAG
jgi:hypothetical protein